MKRIIASALLIATTLSLAACSNTKSTASSTEKRDKTIQVSKKKTAPKKTSSSKKTSAKKVANKANNNSDQQPTDQNTNSQANNTQQAQNQTPAQSQQVADAKNTNNQPDQQSQAQNNQNTQQQAGGISYDENTLTGFVNKYGESPAAYKVEHEGMSTLQALQSTPDNMKTFGEKQTQQGMENGSLNPDGSASNQFGY